MRLPVLFVISRFSSHVSARHLCVAATVRPARSTAMTTPDFPRLHPHRSSATGGEPSDHAPAADPNAFIATLHRIGKGAAADGQPWPERHQMPGRCMALADADCALAGQRVTLELLLAAERVRQNGAEAEYVGDRVMEGLILACLAMNAQVSARMQQEGSRGRHITRDVSPALYEQIVQSTFEKGGVFYILPDKDSIATTSPGFAQSRGDAKDEDEKGARRASK
nr:hypothetical protein [Stenotrophomonas pavanii]